MLQLVFSVKCKRVVAGAGCAKCPPNANVRYFSHHLVQCAWLRYRLYPPARPDPRHSSNVTKIVIMPPISPSQET